MMIKVFLSHQKADSLKAAEIAQRLQSQHQIQSYLDVIDPYLGRPAEDLARHIRNEDYGDRGLRITVDYGGLR